MKSLNWKNVGGAAIAALAITFLILLASGAFADDTVDRRCVSKEKAINDLSENQYIPQIVLYGTMHGQPGEPPIDTTHKILISQKHNTTEWNIVTIRADDVCAIASGEGIQFIVFDSESNDGHF